MKIQNIIRITGMSDTAEHYVTSNTIQYKFKQKTHTHVAEQK